jgi:hypothetical protein
MTDSNWQCAALYLQKYNYRKHEKEHFDLFFSAGFAYDEGVLAFNQMKTGTEHNMKLEPGNQLDHKVIEIGFNDFKLGYAPCANNKAVYAFLKSGVDILEAQVETLSSDMPPEQQMQVVVF